MDGWHLPQSEAGMRRRDENLGINIPHVRFAAPNVLSLRIAFTGFKWQ
jgi:hypothetical protein